MKNTQIGRHRGSLPRLLALAGALAAGLLLGGGRVAAQAGQPPQPAGTCAQVQIHLNQQVAVSRTEFQATLTLGNSPVNVPLQNVGVTLSILDPNGNPANSLFSIAAPTVTGLPAVDGSGTLAPGAQATATWTIVPTHAAAPTGDVQYTVGGTINYTQGGQKLSLPLFPATITVMPDPLLALHYFLQYQVYGQDPFQDVTDPSVPFSLGLLAENSGAGTAYGLRITSSQPQIVDNEKDLQVAFQTIGASVDGQPVTPALQVDLGDLLPGGTSVAVWSLLSSLQGNFLNFNASFTNNDGLGDPRTSILDSVDTHFLEHVVEIVDPQDDGKPDFLAYVVSDPVTNMNALPDAVYSSTGTVSPVTSLTTATASGTVSDANPTVTLTVPNVPAGYFYVDVPDPGNAQYQLVSVTRSDGRVLLLGVNAWLTNRIVRLVGQPATPLNLVHLFDSVAASGPVTYTLNYAPAAPIAPTVSLTAPSNNAQFGPNATVPLTATAESVQANIQEVDFYADGKLLGSSTTLPFTLNYNPAPGTHTLYAVATDANGTTGASGTITIGVSAQATPPPVVSLTSPTSGAALDAPAGITLAASASETGGTITQVAFYQDGAYLGSSVAAPYTLPLTGLAAGTYSFTAVATDDQSRTTTSAPVPLTVVTPLTASGLPILRVVAAVAEPSPGQMMVTVENDGSMDAVNIALALSKIKWGALAPTAFSPSAVPMLAPNSQTTFTLQFPASSSSAFVTLAGTQTGRGFSGLTRVTH